MATRTELIAFAALAVALVAIRPGLLSIPVAIGLVAGWVFLRTLWAIIRAR